MKKLFNASLVLFLFLCFDCHANFPAIVGGTTDPDEVTPSPLAFIFSSSDKIASLVTVPLSHYGFINVVAMGPDGSAILTGTGDYNHSLLVYRVAPGKTMATPIVIPNLGFASIDSVAIGPDGTAILGGSYRGGGNHPIPLILTLAPGATEFSRITNLDSYNGGIESLAIGPNNVAILGGSYALAEEYWIPLICRLATHDTEVSILPTPTAHEGEIKSVAISPNGTAILGGYDRVRSQPIIYTIAPGNDSLDVVKIPYTYGGFINSVAISTDGTAIAGGAISTTERPLIFTIDAGCTSVKRVKLPDSVTPAWVFSVAISPDGTGIAVGAAGEGYEENNTPIAFGIRKGSENPFAITFCPDISRGYFRQVAMAPDGTAFIVAKYGTLLPALYSLTEGESMATAIIPIDSPIGSFTDVSIYPYSTTNPLGK